MASRKYASLCYLLKPVSSMSSLLPLKYGCELTSVTHDDDGDNDDDDDYDDEANIVSWLFLVVLSKVCYIFLAKQATVDTVY